MKRAGLMFLAVVAVGLTAAGFSISSIEWLPTNRVRLAWSSRSGEVYAVERTFEMTQSFAAIASNLPATPPQNVFTDTVPAQTTAAFYRVRATAPETNWWQHAHDAQRTGYAPAAPAHPWRWAWQWNGSDATGKIAPGKVLLPRNVQPIIAEGRVYIAAGTNGVYALNEATGAVLWQVKPGGAINSTVAYDPGTRALFAVSSNGRLYKLNPTNGATIASCVLGTASSLPLPVAVIQGRLFASMGQNVLALDPVTLATNWLYNAGSTVETPPAYSATRDLVVVCTQDLYVHAIRNSDGTRLWRVKPGTHTPDEHHTFANGWPVIAEQHGLVLLRQRIHWDYLWLNPDPFGVPNNATIRARLAAQPNARCHYALRLEDGSIAFHINNGAGGFGDGGYLPIGSMPIVRVFPDGKEVALNIIRGDGRYDARWDSHFGEMVLDTNTVAGLQAGDVRWIRHGNTPNDDDFLLTDEQPFLSAAGDYLFGSHWLVTYAIRPLDRGPTRGTWANKINSTNLSWMIVSQGACGPCTFSSSHYCAQSLNEDPGCGRNYAGGFYVCYNVGGPTPVHDLFWTEYGCVVGLPDKLIVRDTTGAIFCLVSGDPLAAGASAPLPARRSAAAEEPVTVEGELRYVFNNGKEILLAFHEPHRGHFKILIPRSVWGEFAGLGTERGRNRAGLYEEGDRVRVTGARTFYQGDPVVVVRAPRQIEKLSVEVAGR
ncbi:MAG: PQQ-binding-like beta-propeller repeat protein [Verrucomicrobiae bacterium]|nr:PQQ-binding-like beta-propeller repeat protein [Verrucomicrobiae bacterium]